MAVSPTQPVRADVPATRPARDGVQHVVKELRSSRAEYAIDVHGCMDAFNTLSFDHVYYPAFQNNVELTIANVGDAPVRDPRITINGGGDWFDMDALVRASAGRAADGDDEARSYALWDFFRRNIDAGPSYNDALWGETRSVVRFMNCFSSGACGTFHIAIPLVGHAAGLTCESGCLADCSHAVQRENYGGTDHFFDALLAHGGRHQPRGYVPLELDNRTVASIGSMMEDHYLVERVGTEPGFYMNATYFGPGSSFHPVKDDWHEPRTMGITLRPGESITRTWTPVRKGWLPDEPSPASSAEGRVVFEPRLTAEAFRRDAVWHDNVSAANSALTPDADRPGVIVYAVDCPYVIIAGRASAAFDLPAPGDHPAHLAVSFDGENWREVWKQTGSGADDVTWSDDAAPEFHLPHFTHRVYFRAALPAGGRLKTLRMEVTFQAYARSLPMLRVGRNDVRYTDAAAEPHAVRVEHRWRESCEFKPPPAPGEAVHPKNGGEAGFAPTFSWTRPPGDIEAYEFYLSPRDDLAWPLLGPFHSIIPGGEPRFASPVVDALNHGQRYFWRVRARSKGGVWGPWSKTWLFIANGPGRPRDVRIDTQADHEILSWRPPKAGRPVKHYEIYASTDGALSPRREPRTGHAAGKEVDLPATWIAATETPEFDITGREEVFYRVVAVDDAGSRSTPTTIAAAARPVWLAADPPAIEPGKPYHLTLRVRHSIGRWVLHLRKGLIRHQVDEVKFAIKAAPDWLTVNATTSELSGDAPASLAAPVIVTLSASIDGVGSAEHTFTLPIKR